MRTDRRALPVDDLPVAEDFYVGVLGKILGGYIANRYLLSTEEVLQTRKRQALIAKRSQDAYQPLPTLPYTRVVLGDAHVILYLLDERLAAPPPQQLRGLPRMAFEATEAQLKKATRVFRRTGVAFEGPVEHASPTPAARSLYFKDPAGNFLELCVRRQV